MQTDTEKALQKNPFINTGSLPGFIQNFIRWQHEIAGLDVGMITGVENIRIAEGELPTGGGKTKAQKKMEYFWRRFLAEFEAFIRDLMAVVRTLSSLSDINLEYLENLEMVIDEEIEHLKIEAPELVAELEPVKEQIQEAKAEVIAQKEKAESILSHESDPPEKEKVSALSKTVAKTTQYVGNLAVGFYNRLKNIRQAQEETEEAHANIEDNIEYPLREIEAFNEQNEAAERDAFAYEEPEIELERENTPV